MERVINKGYQFKIVPTAEQKTFFRQSFGCARKLYNHYVDTLYTYLESVGYQNGYISMSKIKLDSPAAMKKLYPYMKEPDSLALCNVQLHFKAAVEKFNEEYDRKSYTKHSLKRKRTIGIEPTFRNLKGMPRFKSRKNHDFSYTTNNPIKVKQHRPLPEGSIIKNATISMDCRGNFHVSLCVEYCINIEPKPSKEVLGLDYAQADFYVDSEDRRANYPHYYRKAEAKLAKEQRKLARKVKDSKGWQRQKQKISEIQLHIANQRKDWLHKESRKLANAYDAICVEDMDLRALGQCLHLAKNQQDNGFGMFRTFLKYKLEEMGKQFVKIDKWYPSSKTCHSCGYVHNELQLTERTWICPNCGTHHNRDYNAAINIKEAGTALLAW